MSIQLSSNFIENAQLPLDDRVIQDDSTARDAILVNQRYFGLQVTLLSDGTTWILADAAMGGVDSDLTNNANWISFAGGGGGFWTESGGNLYTTILSDNVGIGIATAIQKLTVDGDFSIRITGATFANVFQSADISGIGTDLVYTLPFQQGSGVGSSGASFMFNDGTGTLTWESPFRTNGTINNTQSIINLVQGTNITLTEVGGSVTIDSTGGGGFWSQSAGTLFPTTSTDRILLGGATDDTTSILQLDGTGNNIFGTGFINTRFTDNSTNKRGVALGYDSGNQIGIVAATTDGVNPSILSLMVFDGTNWQGHLALDGTTNRLAISVPILMVQQTTPVVNPYVNTNDLYFKSDDNLYMLNSAGVETQVNGGGAVLPNPITDGTNGIGGVTSVDWQNRFLDDQSGNASLDWDGRIFSDNATISALNYNSRYLQDSSGNVSVDWTNRKLYYPDGITIAVDFDNTFGTATLNDSFGSPTLDFVQRYLYHSTGAVIDFRDPNAFFTLPESNANQGQLRFLTSIGASTEPSSPVDGTIWYNKTNLKFHTPFMNLDILFQADAETDDIIDVGSPVYMKSTGHLGLAQADNILSTRVVGLSTIIQFPSFTGKFLTNGKFTLADWTAIIGTTSLTPGSIYFLSEITAGQLTDIAPTASGNYVAKVGTALSADTLEISIEETILL